MSGFKFMGKDPSGIAKAVKTSTSGEVITQLTKSELNEPIILQNNASASGAGTDLVVAGYSGVILEVKGTFVAGINVLASHDGYYYDNTIPVTNLVSGEITAGIEKPGIYRVDTSGLQKIRAYLSWVSGTGVTVKATPVPIISDNNTLQRSYYATSKVLLTSADGALRNTTAISTKSVDISSYPLVALRIHNTTGKEISLTLFDDETENSTSWAARSDDTSYSITIPATPNVMFLTDLDWEIMRYMRRLKFRVAALTAPTTGSLTLSVILKR